MAYDDQLKVVDQTSNVIFLNSYSIHEITGERNVNINIVIVIFKLFLIFTH